jgi:NAD(P)-dependent dehydrogenase (short-subunit alcohol dehydrogenase family)
MAELSLFDLSGRQALVTGAGAGIGRGCAFALAMGGADVAVVDIDEELGARTVDDLRAKGCEAIFVHCDVARAESVQAMMDAVVRRFGRLDIAVNNAGIYRAGADSEYPIALWQQVVDVNLTGAWSCATAQMRQMSRQTPMEGKIINVASIGAHMSISNGSYDASKAGLVHLTRTLAKQWGHYNINVNCLSPGYVDPVFGHSRRPEEQQRLIETTPMGRVQRLEDLYGAVMFLASRASDFITGQNLVVDGGHTLSTWLAPLDPRGTPARGEPKVWQ